MSKRRIRCIGDCDLAIDDLRIMCLVVGDTVAQHDVAKVAVQRAGTVIERDRPVILAVRIAAGLTDLLVVNIRRNDTDRQIAAIVQFDRDRRISAIRDRCRRDRVAGIGELRILVFVVESRSDAAGVGDRCGLAGGKSVDREKLQGRSICRRRRIDVFCVKSIDRDKCQTVVERVLQLDRLRYRGFAVVLYVDRIFHDRIIEIERRTSLRHLNVFVECFWRIDMDMRIQRTCDRIGDKREDVVTACLVKSFLIQFAGKDDIRQSREGGSAFVVEDIVVALPGGILRKDRGVVERDDAVFVEGVPVRIARIAKHGRVLRVLEFVDLVFKFTVIDGVFDDDRSLECEPAEVECGHAVGLVVSGGPLGECFYLGKIVRDDAVVLTDRGRDVIVEFAGEGVSVLRCFDIDDVLVADLRRSRCFDARPVRREHIQKKRCGHENRACGP